jgi:uncharacterized protein (TIGR02147 family)
LNYSILSYQKHIVLFVESQKNKGIHYTQQLFSQKIGVQKPYLSKVIAGNAHLSSDQIYLASREMQHNPEESKFFRTIWEYERTGLSERKKELEILIKEIQNKNQQTEKHLSIDTESSSTEVLSSYYLDPINQIVHLALGIPKYQKNTLQLANDLSIGHKHMQEILTYLEKSGYIRWGEQVEVLKNKVHLSSSSPLFWPWKIQLTQLALQRCRNIDKSGRYNFSVIFSADESTRSAVQEQYFLFLKKVEVLVKKADKESVYQMNFDLFNWINDN